MAKKDTCKLCRREGKKLFLKGDRCYTTKCAIVRRNYAPGDQGPKKGPMRKMSVFGRQLREKQIAKRIYNIREKQLVNYFDRASRKKGNTEDRLFQLLEMRLDNVVHRLGFAKSMRQARQLVNHGHFFVNGKKVDIPSYQVQEGNEISVRPKSGEMPVFKNLAERLKGHETPAWLHLDLKNLTGKVVGLPEYGKSAKEFNIKQIIEFYSR